MMMKTTTTMEKMLVNSRMLLMVRFNKIKMAIARSGMVTTECRQDIKDIIIIIMKMMKSLPTSISLRSMTRGWTSTIRTKTKVSSLLVLLLL